MRGLVLFVLLALMGVGVGLMLIRPQPLSESDIAGITGDAKRGQAIFTAAGCASCHYRPGATDDEKLVLAGGQRFASDFGTFIAPNISPDPVHGIGNWTLAEFGSAVMRGVSPDGSHYYPAFPYTAYALMEVQDMADIHAYILTLPASDTPSAAHEITFPFNNRLAAGAWKFLFFDPQFATPESDDPQVTRGRYLSEALAHCGECHTPRGALGNLDMTRWLAGAPNPTGSGNIPPLTPGQLKWSAEDIAFSLETGFTPRYDSAGGHMAAVVENFSKLPPEDRAAVAAYLKALPGG